MALEIATTSNNPEVLAELSRLLRFSESEFALIVAVCDASEQRQELVRQLRQQCNVPFDEMRLPPSSTTLFTPLRNYVSNPPPAALIVYGLDEVLDRHCQLNFPYLKSSPKSLSFAFDGRFKQPLIAASIDARVIVTDKLRSYGAAKKDLIPGVEYRQHKGLNNRAENSHRPTRVRERWMGRFKSPGHAQRFLSAFEPIRGYFHPHQHPQSATEYRATMRQRLSDWQQFTRLSSIA